MAAAVLANFPFKNQLQESDPNDRYDCVAVSFASAIQWLTGKSVTGAQLKDAEYGRNYVGGTALRRYVDEQGDVARAKYGVSADVWSGEPNALVAHTHQLVRQGYPVIATIPSDWNTPRAAKQLDDPSFSTHAICFYGEINGGLEAMNPWRGVRHTGSDGYWDERLCYRQVWRVYRLGGNTPVAISTVLDISKVSGYFTQVSSTQWRCKQNGFLIQDAALAYYRSLPGPAMTYGVLPFIGLPLANRFYLGDVSLTVCERGVIVYDPARKFDNPPGASGPCYLGHINQPRVLEALGASLGSQESPQVAALVQAAKALAPSLSDLAAKAQAAV